ncbi:hypothetical protein KFK09_011585 [Dendrobium nobile]|uniref:DUF4283 domain-containing protein n=1 Tax=Dendrobium nobile TaxID=94219 RepID=A0A8T3BD04_DENNO|nr:hypothetical protein KFK09_011585 [Dendrobium nobile]
MESSSALEDFPPLVTSVRGASPPQRNWLSAFGPPESAPASLNDLHLSNFPSEPEIIPFSGDKLSKGADDWSLCLMGYSIGRRPFYEALLGALKKTWSLKGSIKLLSLSEEFFLIRFSCSEDLEMAWSRGVWFLLGKPFVLQK